MSERAVVLLSGGIDSSTCAAVAIQEFGNDNVTGLSVVYGQKHVREITAAKNVATKLGIRHRIISIPPEIFAESGSSLIDFDLDLPDSSYEQIRNSCNVSPTYVPFRNGLLLSIAAVVGLQVGATHIFYGAHAEDSRNWAYPDCTPEFNGAMMNAVYVGTYHRLQVVTPLQWMTKAEVVAKALELQVPLEATYSCYAGGQYHCGKCSTCLERIKAFKKNGRTDPVGYEVDIDWPCEKIDWR